MTDKARVNPWYVLPVVFVGALLARERGVLGPHQGTAPQGPP